MRNIYLKILELPEHATRAEIKKAYRKKAFQYHPDRNNTPRAEEMFILVNQAYINLSEEIEPEKIKEDAAEFYRKYNKNFTKEELENYLKKVQKAKEYKERKEANILKISLQELKTSFILKLSNTIAIISITFAILLVLDFYILNPNQEFGIAKRFEEAYHGQMINLKLNNNDFIKISTSLDDPNFDVIRANYLVELFQTPIFNQFASLRVFGHRKTPPMVNYSSFYSIIFVLLSLFLLPIFNFISKGPNSFYIIFVHVSLGFPFIGWLICLSF
ncbi:MAG: DnaJ domain-containing protein [Flavobacteriales bacterium]|nr:DnaJ domain-containing protein [Flavobacteriales bacterium]